MAECPSICDTVLYVLLGGTAGFLVFLIIASREIDFFGGWWGMKLLNASLFLSFPSSVIPSIHCRFTYSSFFVCYFDHKIN